MRARTKSVFATILKALPAAPATKVSKPVLFALKMTDLQDPHKKDSPCRAAHPGSAHLERADASIRRDRGRPGLLSEPTTSTGRGFRRGLAISCGANESLDARQ